MKQNTEKIIKAFLPLIISKIQTLATNWEKPWVTANFGTPRNLRGTTYKGLNLLMLMLLVEQMKYKTPIF